MPSDTIRTSWALPKGGCVKHRLEWLDAVMAANSGPIFLFMHHPPFAIGFDRMDRIRLQDADALADVMVRAGERVRHLFVGHLHRNIAGLWRGWSFSAVRGTSHQIALDLTTRGFAPVSFEAPGCAVIRVEGRASWFILPN